MNRDFDNENSTIGCDIQYTGGGIKCKNYIKCKRVLPTWSVDCEECNVCSRRDMMFGPWKSGEYKHIGKGLGEMGMYLECQVCLEIKECMPQPRCNHPLCISCFYRCYHGPHDSIDGEPIFPYPDIAEEYSYDTRDYTEKHITWGNDYPLIKIYEEEWNKWNDKRTEQNEKDENFRICPICRK